MDDKNSLKDLYEMSAIGKANKFLLQIWKKNKKIIIIAFIALFLISSYITGYFFQISAITMGEIQKQDTNIITQIYYGISKGIIISLTIWLILIAAAYRICSMLQTNSVRDEERNYEISTENTYGSAKKMNEEEKKETFNEGNYTEIKDNILGIEPNDKSKLYSLKYTYGINGNVYVVGSPGSGKSRCIAIPNIMQTIRREESMIVSDPKGELYSITKKMAEAHGYTVKMFDVHPDRMAHSDTVDFMSVIGSNLIKAQSFAETILDNISMNKDKDFWYESALNELIMAVLYVNTNDIIDAPKTLGEVYNLLNNNTVMELEAIFEMLDDDHPAKPAYKTWSQCDNQVKGNTHGGLQISLQKLADKKVQQITGRKDIDFLKPMEEKCLYFISFSDQNPSFSFLTALFITLACEEMVGYFDKNRGKSKEGKPFKKVTLLLDELYSLGIIPALPTRLSNMRSRGIDAVLINQSLGQLQERYPENLWESVIDCCSTIMLLRTNSPGTAKFFSDRSGEQTIADSGKRRDGYAGDLLNVHPNYAVSETHGRRMTYTPHEIQTLPHDRILIVVSGHNIAELKKMDYSMHPMCKEIREIIAAEHKPDWVDELSDKELFRMNIRREEYCKEENLPIELCTEKDFSEAWNKEKENALQKKIQKDRERMHKADASAENLQAATMKNTTADNENGINNCSKQAMKSTKQANMKNKAFGIKFGFVTDSTGEKGTLRKEHKQYDRTHTEPVSEEGSGESLKDVVSPVPNTDESEPVEYEVPETPEDKMSDNYDIPTDYPDSETYQPKTPQFDEVEDLFPEADSPKETKEEAEENKSAQTTEPENVYNTPNNREASEEATIEKKTKYVRQTKYKRTNIT